MKHSMRTNTLTVDAPAHRSAPLLAPTVATASLPIASFTAGSLKYPRGIVIPEAFAELARTTSSVSLQPYGKRRPPSQPTRPAPSRSQAASAPAFAVVVASGGALEREASSSKLWVTAPPAKQSTEVLELRKRNAALEAELSSLASSLSGRAMAAVVTDRVEHICEKNQQLRAHVAKLEQHIAELQAELEKKKLIETITQRQLLHERTRDANDGMCGSSLRPEASRHIFGDGAPNTAGMELLQAALEEARAENTRLASEIKRLALEFGRVTQAHTRAEAQLQQLRREDEKRLLIEENQRLAAENQRLLTSHQKAEATLAILQTNSEKIKERWEGRHANALRRVKEETEHKVGSKVAKLRKTISAMEMAMKEQARRVETAARVTGREKEEAEVKAMSKAYDNTLLDRTFAVKLNGEAAKEAVLAHVHAKRVAYRGAAGYLTLTLSWASPFDLNLCFRFPDYQVIWTRNTKAHGGRLDVASQDSTKPLQNIFFTDRPADGNYKVKITSYSEPKQTNCASPVPFDVVIQVGGAVYVLHSPEWAPKRVSSSPITGSSSMDVCELTLHAGTHWLTLDPAFEQVGEVKGSAGLLEPVRGHFVSKPPGELEWSTDHLMFAGSMPRPCLFDDS